MKNKTRILFAINNLTYGGIQTQAVTLAKEFQKKGAIIYFLWTNKYESDFVNTQIKGNGFKILSGKYIKGEKWARYSWKLKKYIPLIKTVFLIKFYKIDYIIPYHNFLSYFFGAIKKYTKVEKIIFHIRNTVIEDTPKENWYFKKALENDPLIITNSKHAKYKFEKIYSDKYKFQIKTIYNGIEIRKINKSKDWKTYFGVKKYNFVVTSIANFFTEKDYQTVFKAWYHFLNITKSNSVLIIAGDEGIKGRMDEYKLEVKGLEIHNSVIFLGRTRYNIELLSISNCNILSTTNEGLPNAVIETLGMKVPFIGTNVDGVKEVLGESYPISTFEIKDYKALSNIITKLYRKEYDIEEIKKYSEDRFKLFSIHNLLKNYSKIIEV